MQTQRRVTEEEALRNARELIEEEKKRRKEKGKEKGTFPCCEICCKVSKLF